MTEHFYQLRNFHKGSYTPGRSIAWQIAWFGVLNLAFIKWWFPRSLRPAVLRLFGATVGDRCNIKHRVRVLWPWRLSLGDDVWIGEGAYLYNMEFIAIRDDCCISQDVYVCTGSHDRRKKHLPYKLAPITIGPGVWVCARSTVLPGTTIPTDAVVPAGAVLTTSSSDLLTAGPGP